ncbi:MAG TPA: hypothetical protein VKT51_09670 [Candidatus Eremiobacteraceae bacterium]|nr:hypothetical protein [Candidatus Eremiobacteraceae bacterium]
MRIRPIIIVGLALIAIAALFVGAGAPFKFALTYPQCVATRPENCAQLSASDVRCNHIGIVCTKYRPHISPWAVAWLIESGAVIVFALAIGIAYGRRNRATT